MVIDSDAHINESLSALPEFLDEPHRSRCPRLIKDTLGLSRILMEGRLYPDPRLRQAHRRGVEGVQLGGSRPGASDPQARLPDLDVEGIDVQVVYGSLGLGITSINDTDFAIALGRALNDYYAGFCAEGGGRLRFAATLPLQDVAASVAELRRAVIELGAIAATIPPNVRGRNLDDASFRPLYETAQALDVPVSIHWGNGAYLPAAGTERFDTHFMVHAIGHPFEQMIALACVVCGGVLEQFPQLRVGFLEAGCSWLPFWTERLHEHWERRGGEMPMLRSDPLEYLARGSCYFTAEPDEHGLPAALETAGIDNIMFASDYPHSDSRFPEAVACLRGRIDLSEDVKQRLLGATAARYYRLAEAPGA